MTTLCYIEKENRYLMMHRIKKKQDANHDKWIGIGGHLEADESPEDCLLREVREETSLTLTSFRLRGIITFISDEWDTEYMFLYTADEFLGTVGECSEGSLEWIPKEQVFDLPVWEGDRLFFRLLAEDAPFFSLKLVYSGDRLVLAVRDGREVLIDRTVHLRPHHGLCMLNFTGHGYDEQFTEAMTDLTERLKRSPDTFLTLTDGCDDLCLHCPNREQDECNSEKPAQFDRNVLSRISFSSGQTLRWSDLMRQTSALNTGHLRDTCPDCEWLELCESVSKKEH